MAQVLAMESRRTRWSSACALSASMVCVFLLASITPAAAQLNQNCIVSVLNRNVQVNADGTWVLPNIPANFGRVRARATCVQNSITQSGESPYFTIPANGSVDVPRIVLGSTTAIPSSITLTSQTTTLTSPGATTQLTATASYATMASANVTSAATGTTYVSTNPQIATVTGDGLVTAVRTGNVFIQATNEGTMGMIAIPVVFGGGADSDGDGIPDDAEIAMGLNPNNPTDALLDLDHDGLTNLEEYRAGTDPRNRDTDGDGISDGDEVHGTRGYVTNPLLADTDGDGVNDLLEYQTNSNPTDAHSVNLAQALSSITATPNTFTLIVNSISGVAYVQLTVTGHLIDGSSINLTSTARGTNYSSSDLNTCNFGAPDGRVFAGQDGSCTITVTNAGFSTTVSGAVQSFSPGQVSYLDLPGYTNGIAVSGDYAYIAAGGAGLQVVSLSPERATPQIAGSLSLPGTQMGVAIVGNRAYVAAGSSGLHVLDISNPASPTLLGTFNTGNFARNVKVVGSTAFVANSSNLMLVNIANPAAMIQTSSLNIGGTVWGVDVDPNRNLAVVAAGFLGIATVDISNLSAPIVRGTVSTGDARNVVVSGNYAFVADHSSSMRSVSIMNASSPTILSTTPQSLGGLLNDIVLSGSFALGGDVFFVNGVPIVDVTDPTNLAPRSILNFNARDDNTMGIAVDSSFVYIVTDHSGLDRGGTFGTARLYIGQFQPRQDLAGVPPTVSITSPANNETHYEGEQLTVKVSATDDVAVASVQFFINGAQVFNTTTAPYQYTFTVPSGTNQLTLSAHAVDLGNNVGNSGNVVVNVLPDPLTLVTGRVLDSNQQPVANATVTASGGLSGVTGSDGRFSIPGVPSVRGDIVVNASIDTPDGTLTGSSSPIAPVRGGTTDVGDISVIAATFETNYGQILTNCDDCAFLEDLPFSFNFYGSPWTQVFVGTNGYFTFGSGDSTYVESLPDFNNRPRIAAFFDDLYGARSGGFVYINNQLPGRFIITHDRVGHYNYGGQNTIQIQLFQDGRIVFAYHGITATFSGTIVGLTPGPNSPASQLDYSHQLNYDAPVGNAIYEYFNDVNTFDLDFGFVIFTPTASGGYNVRTILPNQSSSTGVISNGATSSNSLLTSSMMRSSSPAPGTTSTSGVDLTNAELLVTSSGDVRYLGMTNTDASGNFQLNNVPMGGINVQVRRHGQIIGRASGVLGTSTLDKAGLLQLQLAPVTPSSKTGPNSQ